MNSINELVRAAQAGEREAFALLVGRYQRTAITTAWAVLRDFHTSQDAAQDGFLVAFKQLRSLNNPSTFGPWLMKIVRREAMRLSKRQPDRQTSLNVAGDIELAVTTPWYHEHEDLLNLIARLSDHEREVVVLHYLDGYSAAEISKSLGRPIGTVTKQLSRAINRLRTSLTQVPR